MFTGFTQTCFHVGIVLGCQLVKVAVQCLSAACSAEWKEIMCFRAIVLSPLFQMERVNALQNHCFVSTVSHGKSWLMHFRSIVSSPQFQMEKVNAL